MKKFDKVDTLNEYGRVIYNHKLTTQDHVLSFYENVIRESSHQYIGYINNNVNFQCSSIKEVIKCQKLVDGALNLELDFMQKCSNRDKQVYSTSFSVSYTLNNFTSSNENIKLTTKPNDIYGYRLSKIGTLTTYENMEYICWDSLSNNERLCEILKGTSQVSSDQEAYACSQILSLFTCETSRNPSCFITAPMTLELAEKDYIASQKKYKHLNLDRKLTIKNFVNYNFPPVIEKAVQASRHISNLKNQEYKDEKESIFYHKYDNGRSSVTDSKLLQNKTETLINKYTKSKMQDYFCGLVNQISKSWYDIDVQQLLDMDGSIEIIGDTIKYSGHTFEL